MLNLIVKKRRKNSQTSELENMRSRAGKIVEHSSSKAKEKLCSIQANVGMPPPPHPHKKACSRGGNQMEQHLCHAP